MICYLASIARHAYRRALETACAGPVEVFTIEEALGLSRGVVEGGTDEDAVERAALRFCCGTQGGGFQRPSHS